MFLYDIKALFFVRDFYGDNSREERKHFLRRELILGKKVQVVFKAGEILVGSTTSYEPHRERFFLFSADQASNNIRIYIDDSSQACSLS